MHNESLYSGNELLAVPPSHLLHAPCSHGDKKLTV